MEVRNIIENIKYIAEILRGAGCIFLAGALGLSCYLWRKRCAVFAIVLFVAGMGVMAADYVEASVPGTEAMEEVKKGVCIKAFQRKEESGWEEDGLWLYNKQAEILLLLEEEKLEEDEFGEDMPEGGNPEKDESNVDIPEVLPGNNLEVQMWNSAGDWTPILQEEWEKYNIQFGQDRENREIWYLHIGQEMHCRLVLYDSKGNCSQQQEIIIDWTAPYAETVSVTGTESKKEPAEAGGVLYAAEPLQVCMDINDDTILRTVLCEGYADDGEKIFEHTYLCQDTYYCTVPLDFRGYLRWYIMDICGNETVFKSDFQFCTESGEKFAENAQVNLERCDEASDYCRDSLVLRLYAASRWSGIQTVRIQEGNTVLLEEDMQESRITEWEKILTVTPKKEGNVQITVSLVSLTGQTVSDTRCWIKDTTAPVVTAEWEGEGQDGYFSTSGALRIVVTEAHFSEALWNMEYDCPSGKNGKIRWDAQGNGVYQCRIPFSEDGTYHLKINGTDLAGNTMQPENGKDAAAWTWVVDTQSPKIFISGLENGKHYGKMPEIIIHMEDSNPDFDRLLASLSGDETGEVICKLSDQKEDIVLSFQQKPEDDTYYLRVEGYDLAGNYTQKNISFTVNEKGSCYDVKGLGEKSTFSAGPHLEITEENRSPIVEYQIMYIRDGTVRLLTEGEDYRVERTEGKIYRNHYIFAEELFQKEGYYSITVISKDAAGNSMSTQKNTYGYIPVRFSVDKTAPTILLEEMKKTQDGESGEIELFMQVMENQNLKELHVRTNEKEIFPGEDGRIRLDMEEGDTVLLIEAEDAAGNKVQVQKKYQTDSLTPADSEKPSFSRNGTGSVPAAIAAGIVLILLISLILFYFWKKKACIGNFHML